MSGRMRSLALVGLAATAVVASAQPSEKPAYTVRGIVRKGIDDQGRVHGELAKLTGLANATSLAYKVLLLNDDGTEEIVNADDTVFKFGQQFRIEIESDSDLYVYVFHEGPDGVRTILLPDTIDKGRVPMVRRGQRKVLPDDGTYFEFVPPPGTEKLLVFATPERRDELTPKEAFEGAGEMDKQKMIELKNQQDKVISQAVDKGPKEAITSPEIEKVVQSNEALPEFRLRGMRWEPEAPMEQKNDGQTVLAGSYDPNVRPELYVEIDLRSK